LIGKKDFAAQFANGAIHGTIEFPGMKYVAFNYTNTLYGFYGIDDLDFTTMPLVILDPGHGLLLGDDGRKHYQRPESPAYGLHEDDLTLAMANAAKQQLENDGYEVVMTRTGSDAASGEPCGTPDLVTDLIDYCNGDLKKRIAITQEKKEEVGDDRGIVFVSIHTNGGTIGRLIKGRTQTFYCFDAASTLADQLLNEIAAIAPPVSSLFTGGYQDCDLAVIAKTAGMNIPGSLIEEQS
jgi:N-acetylmuramoyl-L-alanine amidase